MFSSLLGDRASGAVQRNNTEASEGSSAGDVNKAEFVKKEAGEEWRTMELFGQLKVMDVGRALISEFGFTDEQFKKLAKGMLNLEEAKGEAADNLLLMEVKMVHAKVKESFVRFGKLLKTKQDVAKWSFTPQHMDEYLLFVKDNTPKSLVEACGLFGTNPRVTVECVLSRMRSASRAPRYMFEDAWALFFSTMSKANRDGLRRTGTCAMVGPRRRPRWKTRWRARWTERQRGKQTQRIQVKRQILAWRRTRSTSNTVFFFDIFIIIYN
jgi:hypothetical protein